MRMQRRHRGCPRAVPAASVPVTPAASSTNDARTTDGRMVYQRFIHVVDGAGGDDSTTQESRQSIGSPCCRILHSVMSLC